MKPFLLKLDQDVYTQWQSAAKLAGLTLSEWIRRAGNAQLNGAVLPASAFRDADGNPIGVPVKTATEAVMRAEKRSRPLKTAEACPHGALRQFCRFAECRAKR